MPKVKRKPTVGPSHAFQGLPDDMWEDVRIFPSAMARNMAARRNKVLKALARCGTANLWHLCNTAQLTFKPSMSAPQFAAVVQAAAPADTMVYLWEFVRTHGQAVLEQYDSEVAADERTRHESDVESLCLRRLEPVRVCTKFLLMYLRDPQVVRRIHFRHLWRQTKTTAEFETEELPTDAPDRLDREMGTLEATLKTLPDANKAKAFGSCPLTNGPWVFAFHRGYRERVIPEYPKGCVVANQRGYVVFGLHDSPPRLEVKVGHPKIIDVIREWADETLGVKFRRRGLSVYEDYDAAELEKRFLGQYSEEHGIALTGIRFRRTGIPNHPSVTAEAVAGGGTIRDALRWYVEKGAIALRALSDIEWVKVSFGGNEGQVNVSVEADGAVRFTLDNTGWPEEAQQHLAGAFHSTFGIPLGQRISPRPLSMGAVDIFQSLLEWSNADEIQPHQRPLFEDLRERNLLSVQQETLRACATGFCKLKGKVVDDLQVEDCPRCRQPIRTKQLRRIVHNHDQMRRVAGAILTRATKWEFVNTPLQFENNQFFPLRNPARPEESVCVFFSRRIGPSIIEVFDRSHWPVLVVHTSGTYEHALLDLTGVAHLGFAYALAATRDKETKVKFLADCESTLAALMRNGQERVLRAARVSRELLANKPAECTGGMYESVVFGLLRSIFPHTMRWGGPFRPDGFCSLLYSRTNSLKDIQKFNWSYDSKYSERHGGYEFGAPEHRKMLDYVAGLVEQKELQTDGNQLNAHVIITNSLSRSRMKDAAQFLRRTHRLGTDLPGLTLVFMMEPFLVTLYDRVRRDEVGFGKRWGYVSQRLAELMGRSNADDYIFLDTPEAEAMADWVLRKPPVETPIDIEALQEGLDETMSGK
jgi:hypothetical protein